MILHHLHLNMIAAMLAFRLGCQSLTPWPRQPNEGPCEPSAFPQRLSNLSHVSLWLRTVLCSAFDYTWTDLCRSSSTSPQLQKFYFDPTPSMTSANRSRFSLMSSFPSCFSRHRFLVRVFYVVCLFHVCPFVWFSLFSFACFISFHLSNVRIFNCLLVYSSLLWLCSITAVFSIVVFKALLLFFLL